MKTKWKYTLILCAGLVAGYWLGHSRSSQVHDAVDAGADDAKVVEYTCSMHPQIRQPNPGLCPLCAMDLIPVQDGDGADAGPRAISMSPAARALARIETTEVTRRKAGATLSLSGKVAYDTSRMRDVALLSEGQIRTLYANVIGMEVAMGDPLAEIYSPDVFAAYRELIIAGAGATNVAEAARRKLQLFGVETREIDEVIQSGEARDTYVVRSPINGVVTGINGNQGQWVMRGQNLVQIADPFVVWALLDVYERDIGVIKQGQPVILSSKSLPDGKIEGTIVFIPPDLDEMSRSVKVRVDVENSNGQLKPGMFVDAKVQVSGDEEAMLVPATAVLMTGKRAVVYIESPEDAAVFEGRVITVGPRMGDDYIVTDGLNEGERVVTRGAMRVDSSLQILAKPSMMSLASEGVAMRPQTHCPIVGGKIDRNDFVDYKGMRIYFCCPGCDEDFLADPEKYLAEMRAQGVEPERAPVKEVGHEHHH